MINIREATKTPAEVIGEFTAKLLFVFTLPLLLFWAVNVFVEMYAHTRIPLTWETYLAFFVFCLIFRQPRPK